MTARNRSNNTRRTFSMVLLYRWLDAPGCSLVTVLVRFLVITSISGRLSDVLKESCGTRSLSSLPIH